MSVPLNKFIGSEKKVFFDAGLQDLQKQLFQIYDNVKSCKETFISTS